MDQIEYIFSENSVLFLKRIKKWTTEILNQECGIKVNRTRFYIDGFWYPLNFIVFQKRNTLGFFDSTLFQIALNKNLILSSDEKMIKDVLRHEIAHYLHWIENENRDAPHGMEYKDLCRRFSWGPDVYLAKQNDKNDFDGNKLNIKSEAIVNKVKKLLSLATSDNSHEAKLAAQKANELLKNYQINALNDSSDGGSPIILKRLFSFKRANSKITAIQKILRSFSVECVLNYGNKCAYLEVIGDPSSVEIAHYVGEFLNDQLEREWIEAKKSNPSLSGQRAKNSFFRGLAKGFLEKEKKEANQKFTSSDRDLIHLHHLELQNKLKSWVYPRMGHSHSQARDDHGSKNLGQKAGSSLSISKAMGSKGTSGKPLLLGF